mmetsp:Transcript_11406/g.42582  ORF Transcript_11406/g.42582 Transcript_11406/m.42582 type:complete len:207 (+) Transcript_11406:2086-2706(+)
MRREGQHLRIPGGRLGRRIAGEERRHLSREQWRQLRIPRAASYGKHRLPRRGAFGEIRAGIEAPLHASAFGRVQSHGNTWKVRWRRIRKVHPLVLHLRCLSRLLRPRLHLREQQLAKFFGYRPTRRRRDTALRKGLSTSGISASSQLSAGAPVSPSKPQRRYLEEWRAEALDLPGIPRGTSSVLRSRRIGRHSQGTRSWRSSSTAP